MKIPVHVELHGKGLEPLRLGTFLEVRECSASDGATFLICDGRCMAIRQSRNAGWTSSRRSGTFFEGYREYPVETATMESEGTVQKPIYVTFSGDGVEPLRLGPFLYVGGFDLRHETWLITNGGRTLAVRMKRDGVWSWKLEGRETRYERLEAREEP